MPSPPTTTKRTLWAIADLHLALSSPDKDMGVFGPPWEGYHDKLKARWLERVRPGDLVAIPGDISWAMRLDRAREDLLWLDALPGTKILIRGNHDYWWSSAAQLARCLPPTCHALCGPALRFGPVAFAGTRLWESRSLPPSELLPNLPRAQHCDEAQERIFEREMLRLERSLMSLPVNAPFRVALTHYPPIGWQLKPTRASQLFERYKVQWALFGHLHGASRTETLFGERAEVHYALTAADYLDFAPLRVFDFAVPHAEAL